MFTDTISKNFIGDIPSDEYEFIAKPPIEIGKVLMGHSTIKKGKKILNRTERIVQIVGFAIAGLAIGFAITHFANVHKLGWQIFWPLFMAAVGAIIRLSMINYYNYYLAEKGLARISMKGPDEVGDEEILVFSNASHMIKGLTDKYKNFVYQGTDFSYKWYDNNNEQVYEITGTYQSKEGTPKYDSSYEYYWGLEAEKLWTDIKYKEAVDEINKTGFYEFGTLYGEKYRLGFGFIEKMNKKGEIVRIDESEVKEAYAKKGTLYIKTYTGSKWFKSGDAIEIEFNNIHNSRVFLSLFYQMLKVDMTNG